jgi:thiosulfate dehydrogenase [quinone] large subunit
MSYIIIEESPLSKFLFSNTKVAWFWLLVRIFVGYQWLGAGLGKIVNPNWFGPNAGGILQNFVNQALTKTSGTHPDVSLWYSAFLQNIVLSHLSFWSHLVVIGEILVGLGLIIGALTGIAAFFGMFMNLNFLFAGAVSVNPLLFVLSIGLVLAWRVAGFIGIDRFLLPKLGTPWQRKF